METLQTIWDIIIALWIFKAIVMGADFDIRYWIMYRKKYTDWYNVRQKHGFKEYLKETK